METISSNHSNKLKDELADGENIPPSESRVDDHDFMPKDQMWGLCAICKLARASHRSGPVYKSDAPRAEPEKVGE